MNDYPVMERSKAEVQSSQLHCFRGPKTCKFHHVCSADSSLQLICSLGLLNAWCSSAARALFGLIFHCGEVFSHLDQKAYV
jgi:hypothetical protein